MDSTVPREQGKRGEAMTDKVAVKALADLSAPLLFSNLHTAPALTEQLGPSDN